MARIKPKERMQVSAGTNRANPAAGKTQVKVQVRPLPDAAAARLFDDARLYPIQFAGADRIDLVPMTYETYHRSTFLDRRIQPAMPEVYRASVRAVEAAHAAVKTQPAPHFIFHSAFCCSSLLASALSRLPGTLVLKEPVTLLQVALGATPPSRLALVRDLLARRNQADDQVVIKASSACNVVAADLMAGAPAARAVFLYSSLRSFILAVVKDPGRPSRMRETLGAARPLQADFARIGMWWPDEESAPDIMALDDASLAALVWIGRMRAGARLQQTAGPERVTLLDGGQVAAQPETALTDAVAGLNLSAAATEIDRIVASDLWSRHAKSPALAYDETARKQELAEIAANHRTAVDAALIFAERLMETGTDATFTLARKLAD